MELKRRESPNSFAANIGTGKMSHDACEATLVCPLGNLDEVENP